ncbi:amidohydrolase family protein [Horticoccus sp. 23ND18S-11]|uniref:amidohydrolase family protein n=1 Tax=Horticoccus sp. 23ND18S-11 TaxID=3391832 RepID=UPI0039C9D202
MQRREFIKATITSSAALSAATTPAARSQSAVRTVPTAEAAISGVDTNVSLFHWPFRRLPLDETDTLVQKMSEHGITTAWAGSFEGILHRDLAGVNQRLADSCRRSNGRLLPFGAINLALPDWEDDLRRCHEVHRMPGVRLHPNYHGYTLADPRFKRCLQIATERGLLVQIAVLLEDTRTQHPLLVVPDVDVAPLAEIVAAVPKVRVQLLNSGKVLDGAHAVRLAATPGVHFDIARVETAGGVGKHLRALPAGRLVFGTHAPFFIYESAVIKLQESALTAAETRALLDENPRRLLAG